MVVQEVLHLCLAISVGDEGGIRRIELEHLLAGSIAVFRPVGQTAPIRIKISRKVDPSDRSVRRPSDDTETLVSPILHHGLGEIDLCLCESTGRRDLSIDVLDVFRVICPEVDWERSFIRSLSEEVGPNIREARGSGRLDKVSSRSLQHEVSQDRRLLLEHW